MTGTDTVSVNFPKFIFLSLNLRDTTSVVFPFVNIKYYVLNIWICLCLCLCLCGHTKLHMAGSSSSLVRPCHSQSVT
jgi:hypothetical protein